MKTDTVWRYYLTLILLLGLLSGHSQHTFAAEFTVNGSYDVNDLEAGNNLCVAYIVISLPFVLPVCTLRAAIEETNQLPGPDIIHIPSGTFHLEISGLNEDNSATGDLDITDSLHIRGSGVNKTSINVNGLDRVFDIISPDIEVIIEDLTITQGLLPPLLPNSQKGGGGIRNKGTLTLRNVVVANNLVNGSAPTDVGGGVYNLSNCTLENSTIKENRATSGGGIYNESGAALKITTSTVESNTSLSGGGITNNGFFSLINSTVSGNNSTTSPGGAIYNTSSTEILQSTIAFNTSIGLGGGLVNNGQMWLTNTIIANNSHSNCLLNQALTSLGNNIDDRNSCNLNSPTDLIHTDPKLGSLQQHGGPTLTHGLFIGSPAVDKGQDLSSQGIINDQRGVPRPVGDAFDIGAFETKKRSIVPILSPLLCCSN